LQAATRCTPGQVRAKATLAAARLTRHVVDDYAHTSSPQDLEATTASRRRAARSRSKAPRGNAGHLAALHLGRPVAADGLLE
jgi:Ni,Fe-hydrogenase III large subunit